MPSIGKAVRKHAERAIAETGDWLSGVPAIVADNQDPERRHRVRVIIPSIDENAIYDEWASQMVFCLGQQRGTAFIPPRGSEVVLFGRLSQKYGLYYASLYNEDMTVPEGFNDENTVGAHVPGDLKLIADLLALLQGENASVLADQLVRVVGANVQVVADQLARLAGNSVEVNADGSVTIHGNTVTMNSDGSVTIQASGNLSFTAAGNVTGSAGGAMTLEGRVVRKVGPPI